MDSPLRPLSPLLGLVVKRTAINVLSGQPLTPLPRSLKKELFYGFTLSKEVYLNFRHGTLILLIISGNYNDFFYLGLARSARCRVPGTDSLGPVGIRKLWEKSSSTMEKPAGHRPRGVFR